MLHQPLIGYIKEFEIYILVSWKAKYWFYINFRKLAESCSSRQAILYLTSKDSLAKIYRNINALNTWYQFFFFYLVCHYISLSQEVIVSNPIDLRKNDCEIKWHQNKVNLRLNEVYRNRKRYFFCNMRQPDILKWSKFKIWRPGKFKLHNLFILSDKKVGEISAS